MEIVHENFCSGIVENHLRRYYLRLCSHPYGGDHLALAVEKARRAGNTNVREPTGASLPMYTARALDA